MTLSYSRKEKNTLYIFLISTIIHFFIFFIFFNVYKSKEPVSNQNIVEINIAEYQNDDSVSTPTDVGEIDSELDTKDIDKINLEDIKPLKLDKVKVEKSNLKFSDIGEIPSDIPLTYNLANSKSDKTEKKVSNIDSKPPKAPKNIDRSSEQNYLTNYLGSVRSKIEKNKNYPLIARKMGIEGVVGVEFKIFSNGKVELLKIIKSSGAKSLDQAAFEAIKKSEPFPQFPELLNKENLMVNLSIVFKID